VPDTCGHVYCVCMCRTRQLLDGRSVLHIIVKKQSGDSKHASAERILKDGFQTVAV